MALLVVAYPQLTAADYAWIQAIRQQHDAHYSLIAPHFTLVFPLNSVDQAACLAHITASTRQIGSISFSIRCAMIVKDAFGPLTHLFLVPDEGYSALVKLHDALYVDLLADHLRLDVAFIPHMTIGGHAEPRVCKASADQINHQNRCIQGSIDAVDLISHENATVTTIEPIALAG
jgi:2'-5' RNA ligase